MTSPPRSQFVTSLTLQISLTAAADASLIALLYATIPTHLMPVTY